MSTNPPVTDRFRAGRPSTTSSATRRRALRAVTMVAAVLAAVLVWILIVPIFGVDLIVTGAALLAGAAGWALLATLEHLTRSAVPAWTVVAVLVLAVSLADPIAAASAIATASLIVLHILVGTVVVLGMRRSARRW